MERGPVDGRRGVGGSGIGRRDRAGGEPAPAGHGRLSDGRAQPRRRSALPGRTPQSAASALYLPAIRRPGVCATVGPPGELGPGHLGRDQHARPVLSRVHLAPGRPSRTRTPPTDPVVSGPDGPRLHHGAGPADLELRAGQHRVGGHGVGRPHGALANRQTDPAPWRPDRHRGIDQTGAVGLRALPLRDPPDTCRLGCAGHLRGVLAGDRDHRPGRFVVLLHEVRNRCQTGGWRLLHQQPEPAGRGRPTRPPRGLDRADHRGERGGGHRRRRPGGLGVPVVLAVPRGARLRQHRPPGLPDHVGPPPGLGGADPHLVGMCARQAPRRSDLGRGRGRTLLLGSDLEGTQRRQQGAGGARVATAGGERVLRGHRGVHGGGGGDAVDATRRDSLCRSAASEPKVAHGQPTAGVVAD